MKEVLREIISQLCGIVNDHYEYDYSPCIWKDPPKGLKGRSEEMVTITFHALLGIDFWDGFDNATSNVYIRCGSSELGNWNCDHGPMTVFERYFNICAYSFEM